MINKLKISERLKNIFRIISGTMVGQLISILTLPIITRIYGAEIMGIWATILSISIITYTAADLGIGQVIMVSETRDSSETVYQVVSTLAFIICLTIAASSFLFYKAIQKETIYCITVAVFVFIYSYTMCQVNICYIWLNREANYCVLMKNPIICYGCTAFFAIVLGILGLKSYGYFIGVTAGQLITLLHMKRALPAKRFLWNFRLCRKVVLENIEFVKYQLPSSIMLQASGQLPNIVIGILFGETILGYYSVAQKILSIPISCIGQAVGRVFYQTTAEFKRNKKPIGSFVIKNFKKALVFSLVSMALIAAYGDVAVRIFIGESYITAGVLTRIITFNTLFLFVTVSLKGLEIIINKQKYLMYSSAAQLVASLIAVIIGNFLGKNIYITVILISLFVGIIQIWYLYKIFYVLKYAPKDFLLNIIVSILAFFILAICLRKTFIHISYYLDLPLLNSLRAYFIF